MLGFIFGKTFWSTVFRPAAFFPLLMAIGLLSVYVLGSPEGVSEISSVSGLMWLVTGVWGLLFGSWFGWGLAYWRFDERPTKPGDFAKYPLVIGLVFGPVYWVLLNDLTALNPEFAEARFAATVFGFIVGPPMALLVAAFWRYAPQFTALRKSRK